MKKRARIVCNSIFHRQINLISRKILGSDMCTTRGQKILKIETSVDVGIKLIYNFYKVINKSVNHGKSTIQ